MTDSNTTSTQTITTQEAVLNAVFLKLSEMMKLNMPSMMENYMNNTAPAVMEEAMLKAAETKMPEVMNPLAINAAGMYVNSTMLDHIVAHFNMNDTSDSTEAASMDDDATTTEATDDVGSTVMDGDATTTEATDDIASTVMGGDATTATADMI